MPEFDAHQSVSFLRDPKTGLKAIVAVHNSNLGPATGGTRMYDYKNESDALRDVLNLSKAMTYKCALAGVNFGGGKAVIIGKESKKSSALFKAYGKKINEFRGAFTTGCDVGITEADTGHMAMESEYILGHKTTKHATSEMAALGVFYGIEAALVFKFGKADFKKRIVAIKGLGKIGGELLRLLYEKDTTIIAADLEKALIREYKKKYPKIKIVSPRAIMTIPADVYAPCALGGDLTKKSIQKLKAKIIAGGANNQLEEESVGALLHKGGILYVPDYVLNAGGLIHIVDELEKNGYNERRVLKRIERIKKTVTDILRASLEKNIPTNEIANMLAERIIYKKRT